MKATLSKWDHTGNIAANRKEDHFREQYSAVANIRYGGERGLKECVTVRIYRAATRVYCCVWINSRAVHTSGGGWASGGGYHKPSAALSRALDDAGVKLSEGIDGCGESAMEDAMRAIATALGYKNVTILRAHG